MSAVGKALARRARTALEAGPGGRTGPAATTPAPGLLASLRHHLLAGETHYPDRPGMVDLRRLVGAALPGIGYPERGPDGILITASEGESLFVTLLGVGAGKGARFTGSEPGRHGRLFGWMGLARTEIADPDDQPAAYRYHDLANAPAPGPPGETDVPEIHATGDHLFRSDHRGRPDDALANVIVVGSLDGLRAMRPFRLGFVAAEPETLTGIAKWKQASSICSPAPSQRAALWARGLRP